MHVAAPFIGTFFQYCMILAKHVIFIKHRLKCLVILITLTVILISNYEFIELNTFYYQLMHITLKNAELLKHSKLDKNAPTCFGLHRNHLQGAKVSAWLKITRLVDSICVKDVQGVVNAMAAYCDL